jgi:hypothetical protein
MIVLAPVRRSCSINLSDAEPSVTGRPSGMLSKNQSLPTLCMLVCQLYRVEELLRLAKMPGNFRHGP